MRCQRSYISVSAGPLAAAAAARRAARAAGAMRGPSSATRRAARATSVSLSSKTAAPTCSSPILWCSWRMELSAKKCSRDSGCKFQAAATVFSQQTGQRWQDGRMRNKCLWHVERECGGLNQRWCAAGIVEWRAWSCQHKHEAMASRPCWSGQSKACSPLAAPPCCRYHKRAWPRAQQRRPWSRGCRRKAPPLPTPGQTVQGSSCLGIQRPQPEDSAREGKSAYGEPKAPSSGFVSTRTNRLASF